MSIETDVTENRQRGIGGSDIAAIMGDSPFTTRWELLQYKVGIKENDFKGNEYTRYGQMIEPKNREYLSKSYHTDFEPDYIEENADEPISYFYHSDGCSNELKRLIEIKSTSRVVVAGDGNDPLVFYKGYFEQLAYGMRLHGFTKGTLAVYERPNDLGEEFDPWRLQVYEVTIDDLAPLTESIVAALIDFKADWTYLKEHKDIGESDLPSRYAVTNVVSTDLKIGEVTIPVAWLLQNEKEITAKIKDIKEELKDQMEEHKLKSVQFNDLGLKATYVPKGKDKTVQKFDEKAFKEDNPSLYEAYLKDTVQKGKAGYVRLTIQK